jgi:hypothetical protein
MRKILLAICALALPALAGDRPPDHPGRGGVGPGTLDKPPHDSDIHDDAGEPID